MKRRWLSDIKIGLGSFLVTLCLLLTILFPLFDPRFRGPVAAAGENWYNTDWSYRKLITINASKVGGKTLTNFPMLVYRASDTDLAADAQDDGDDICFVSYTDNTTKYNHEIEMFNGTSNGKLIAWLNVTSLSGTTNTKVWMYYGNSGCSNQQNVVGTWDSNYRAVFHIKYSGDLNDSTGHFTNTNFTNTGVTWSSTAGPGALGWCLVFDSVDDKLLINSFPDLGATLTGEMWFKRVTSPNAFTYYFCEGNDYTAADWTIYARDSAGGYRYIITSTTVADGGTQPANGYWWKFSTTWNDPTNWADARRNTTSIYHYSSATAKTNVQTKMYIIGTSGTGASARGMTGNIDEVRFSNVVRSNASLNAGYNSTSSPSSFHFFGDEEAKPVVKMWYTKQTVEGVLQNTTTWKTKKTITGVVINATSFKTIQTIQGLLLNTTGFKTTQTLSGVLQNISVTHWYTIQTVSGVLQNLTGFKTTQIIQGVLQNITGFKTTQTLQGMIQNITGFKTIQTIDGIILNSTKWSTTQTLNGSIQNISIFEWVTIQELNGILQGTGGGGPGTTKEWHTIKTINGMLVNGGWITLETINGTIQNSSHGIQIIDIYPTNGSHIYTAPTIVFTLIQSTGSSNFTVYTGNSTVNTTQFLFNDSLVGNGTYHGEYYDAIEYYKTYYWSVHVLDKYSWLNETYHFTIIRESGMVLSSTNTAIGIVGLFGIFGIIGFIVAMRKRRQNNE